MRIKQILCISSVFLCFILILSGCTSKSSAQGDELENIIWQLQSYGETGNQRDVIYSTEISLEFDGVRGKVFGSSGANAYFGRYDIGGAKMSISELAWTEMYRLDPPGVMEQEAEYLKIIAESESFTMKDGILQIYSGENALFFTEKVFGILKGNVIIGPITPVEIAGIKPTVPPEAYEARKIMVFGENGVTIIAKLDLDAQGYYEIALEPGKYLVDINRIGMDRSLNVPSVIEITANQTIELDIDIDTGIR